jgi:MFS family permease
MTSVCRPIAAAVAAVMAGVLPMFATAGLAPRIDGDFAFGTVGLAVAVAAFHATSALVSPRFGRWVERAGPARGLSVSAWIATGCSIAVAVAGRSAAMMVVLLAVAGVANGASGPAASALLSHSAPAGRRGLAFGAQQAGAPLAALLAGAALSVVAGPLGWRAAFVLAAGVAVVAAALVPRGPALARPPLTSRACHRPGEVRPASAVVSRLR